MENKQLLTQMLSKKRLEECWNSTDNNNINLTSREHKVHPVLEVALTSLKVVSLVYLLLMLIAWLHLKTKTTVTMMMKKDMKLKTLMIKMVTQRLSKRSMKSSRKFLTKSWMMLTPDLNIWRKWTHPRKEINTKMRSSLMKLEFRIDSSKTKPTGYINNSLSLKN